MKAIWRRYLNEIVGLTIMALMAVALIDGQAHANVDSIAGAAGHKVVEIRFTIGD
ncbi:MAG: hypothetical protein GWN47_04090 [Woeseiaceae bacterium]|nr:hypothetical protein [Woeseiaceae bacterium]